MRKRLKARHRAIIWLAAAIGGAGGALAAVANRSVPAPAPVAAASFKSVTEIGASPAPAAGSAATPLPTSEAASPTSSAAPVAAAAAQAPAASAVAAEPKSREVPTVAPAAPPTTAEELTRTEIACYEDKEPDQCQRAAAAYETGSAGAQDAARGKNFRKIALNFYVKQCEAGLPHACFVLAGMYRSGTLVQPSERQVKVLLDRAAHLCTLRTAEECKLAGL